MTPINQSEINAIAWRACDTFRGTIDATQYKDYILVMLFLKYVSDMWKDKLAEAGSKYKGDKERIERALRRERFYVPKESAFDYLYSKREATNLGQLINDALEKLEDANKAKLENVFRNIDFNSEPNLGQTKERNRRLKNLLDDFANEKLDLRPSRIGNLDVIGNVYEYLIGHFASDAGKKGGEFYTPPEVAELLARLLQPKPGDRICDPACGSGSLLIRVGQHVKDRNVALYGQENNGSTWALCRMNMFLHGFDNARIEWCNTLTDPKLLEGDKLMKFNVVVANPPFSLDKWGAEEAKADRFNRYYRGIPPKSKGDFAFISHMVAIAQEDGRVGVIVPHGVLFRGGSEGVIRKKLIEENLLEAVIGLPENLFFGVGIPVAVLIFNKAKKTKNVLFIDASREYDDRKTQNFLRESNLEKITSTFLKFKSVEGYAIRATFKQIEENDFNLNIPRYVVQKTEENEVDLKALQHEIDAIEDELAKTRKEMKKLLTELGV